MACRKEPDMSATDGNYFVYTSYDTEVDFTGYTSYIVADSILVMNSGRYDYLKASESAAVNNIVQAYNDEMARLGYVKAASKEDADLGIQISYIEDTRHFVDYVTDPYWWWGYPGYWDPFYWGYGGYWGYSFPVYYSYDTNSLLTEIIDLTASDKSEDAEVPVLWNSFITGVSTGYAAFDIRRTVTGINQSFEQSPDFKAAQQ